MTVLLLANVGNRDVQLRDPSLLPESLQGQRIPARTLGEELLSNLGRYADALEYPLIGVSVRWLLEHEDVNPEELYVHLFASNQPQPPVTPEGEWLKDSAPLARVIQRFLIDGGLEWTEETEDAGKLHTESRRLRLPKRQVRIHYIPGNPANYKNTLDHFRQELGRMTRWVEEGDNVYLEVTGGTPAMTSMMIISGVDVFGQQARTLYVERGADRPYCLGVGRRLFSRHVHATLCTQLDLYAYAAAGATFQEQGHLVAPNAERQALIAALLEYADRRLAFDFDRARDAISAAYQYATGETQSWVQHWQREMAGRDSAALLAELIHSTCVKQAMGDYADFTQRLFRFQEASFHHLAKRMGMVCQDDEKEEYVDMQWLTGVPGLKDFLADYTAPDGKRYRPVHVEGRSLNRISLGAIVAFFIETDPQWRPMAPIAQKLHRLSSVANLRNAGLAGHGFQGIGKQDLDRAFGEDSASIVPMLEETYEDMFGQSVGPSPYSTINQRLYALLET